MSDKDFMTILWLTGGHFVIMTCAKPLDEGPALKNFEIVRPNHAVFFPPVSNSLGRGSDRERYIVYSCSLLVQN